MDLYHHPNPLFTRWIIENRLLQKKFVVVDIGCQGGEHPRWNFLGDSLEFHGFDPLAEVIARLRNEHRPGRNFHELALGNEDGERNFFVPTNSFSASFYPAGPTVDGELRRVRIRRLDTL